MDVYLLRHAESEFNVDPVNNDSIDCSLTRQGEQQATALELSNPLYDLILCSPLRRCRQTVHYATLLQGSSRIKIEICFQLREQLKAKCDLLPDEGTEVLQEETDESVRIRVQELNNYLRWLRSTKCPPYKKILLVSHADFLWNLTSYEVGDERFGTWLDNCELMFWKTL
jgi:broad specificity phosphatase PhoE